ncbi:Abi family protein [Shouchella rhizosphaerae]|uniref:Abi family protein n=1 Tax=Shouchella rhizosphaerae TaxID=866786 RepID=UPI003F81E67D
MLVGEKPFITLDKQLEKLKKRGLTIDNPEKAKLQLLKTTYYDLINGYKDMFLYPKASQSEEDRFIENTTFEDILTLYTLDRDLRYATLEILLDVECMFYSSLAYSISEIYGEKESVYLKKENYRIGRKQRNYYERDNLLWRINKKLKYPEVQPLIYYKERYGNIPPWILVKDLTFGELVMLYKLSTDNIKTNVVRYITGAEVEESTKEFFFKSMVLFNKFRNWAAHGGRIYNHRPKIELPYDIRFFDALGLNKKDHNQGKGKNDFASLLIAIMFFYQNDYNGVFEFIGKVNEPLSDFKSSSPLQYEKILIELGIPSNFYNLVLSFIGISV